ncbi:hypothetical protein BKA82DRAFT_1002454 [Pisolithus tinctorius]|uniref:Copper acquisition factor BIM1-like domain-containing protein n=1 Tax=Pisolithus tinctorius Marx 270 TaxID=870435 RepID=A0A0C3P572_PISTI|nr:hypothetical protein BKA82DRAFT_1002454 [Pisolithus tinctorius]KIO02429.1 hypothetical protein M404DRAFT_1002454 [Pisolithus tinctorius Marx 270]
MQPATLLPLVLAAVANAHFQLQYPAPRGPFVAAQEPTFCDGYTNPVSNRTVFPLANGVINFISKHPDWIAGVIVSTKQSPTSFSDFNSSSGYQMAVQFFKSSGEGQYCFPIDLATSGVSGIQDGANVTVQVIYDSGEENLYQCADLTLSANATVPSNATSTCTNVTVSASGTASAFTSTATQTGSAKKDGVMVSGIATTVFMALGLSFF